MPPEAATSDKAGPGKPDGAGAAIVIDGQSSGRQRAGACSARASGSTAKDQPPVAGEPAKRSEERRVGKRVSVRVDLGGSRLIKKKKNNITIEKQNILIIHSYNAQQNDCTLP